jgi:tetratricopeptide (TPR) repeat protein
VPYPRNPRFTGQTSVLETIFDHLSVRAIPGFTSSYALYGLGGIGKTQIAIEYANLHMTEFDMVCWLPADDYETLVSSYVKLSRDLEFISITELRLEDDNDHESIAKKTKAWFENTTEIGWLLIFDNADKLEDLARPPEASHPRKTMISRGRKFLKRLKPKFSFQLKSKTEQSNLPEPLAQDSILPHVLEEERQNTLGSLIPRGRTGSVLVTSRNRSSDGELTDFGGMVGPMMAKDATDLLLKCSRATDLELSEAQALVSTLGFHPLAIEQAGGFIRKNGISIARYSSLYESNKSAALKEGLSLTHHELYYQHTIATTWEVSFKAIENIDPLATKILRLVAFLDGKNIQRELFTDALTILKEEGSPIVNEWEIDKSFGLLMSYSLLDPTLGDGVQMHLLVQQVIRSRLGRDLERWLLSSINLVGQHFSGAAGDLENLKKCLRYVSHARQCAAHTQTYNVMSSEVLALLESLGGYLRSTRQSAEAMACYDRALHICEQTFGANHVKSANIIMCIGLLYSSQMKHIEAISFLKRSLRITELEVGRDHIDSANIFHNLGVVYEAQESYDEACAQYNQALAVFEKVHGTRENLDAAETINNLGNVYLSQRKYVEAISCFELALTIFEGHFGKGHIKSAYPLHNMGNAYTRQGKFNEALGVYLRALDIKDTELGKDHIMAATTLNSLGDIHKSRGNYQQALVYFKRWLGIYETTFKGEHVDSVAAIICVGDVFVSLGDYVQAMGHYERARDICDRKAEEKTARILSAGMLNSIGDLYRAQEKNAEALAFYQRAEVIANRELGVDHINSIQTIINVGSGYQSLGLYEEALSNYQHALEICDRELGRNNSDSATVLNSIGDVLRLKAEYDAAMRHHERALSINGLQFGAEHINSVTSMINLGLNYEAMEKYEAAMVWYQRALKIYDRENGVDHLSSTDCITNIGDIYMAHGDYSEATIYYKRTLKILQRELGLDNIKTVLAMTRESTLKLY